MDVIVLVGTIAVGLSMCRWYSHVRPEWPGMELHRGMSFMEIWSWIYRRNCMLMSSSIILSAVLLALRMRHPRPRFRRLMRQPGTVACWTVLFVVTLRLLGILEGVLLAQIAGLKWHEIVFDIDEIDWSWFPGILFIETEHIAPQICLSVAVGWMLLFLSGWWRAEPSWIDRMGITLGIYYIIMIPFFLWLFPFSL